MQCAVCSVYDILTTAQRDIKTAKKTVVTLSNIYLALNSFKCREQKEAEAEAEAGAGAGAGAEAGAGLASNGVT